MAGIVDKQVKFVKFYLIGSNIEPIVDKLWLCRLGRTNQRIKDAIVCGIELVHSLAEGKKCPVALHKIPTQTVDSSRVFEI